MSIVLIADFCVKCQKACDVELNTVTNEITHVECGWETVVTDTYVNDALIDWDADDDDE